MAPLWEKGPQDGRLLRLLLSHCALGVAVGLALTAAFLALDVAGLRSVIFATREAWLALFMLSLAMAALFGSMAMGVGVMTLPRDFGKDSR